VNPSVTVPAAAFVHPEQRDRDFVRDAHRQACKFEPHGDANRREQRRLARETLVYDLAREGTPLG